jgi:signal peptidase I
MSAFISGLLAATIGIIVASAWILIRPPLTSDKWMRPVIIVAGSMIPTLRYGASPLPVK